MEDRVAAADQALGDQLVAQALAEAVAEGVRRDREALALLEAPDLAVEAALGEQQVDVGW